MEFVSVNVCAVANLGLPSANHATWQEQREPSFNAAVGKISIPLSQEVNGTVIARSIRIVNSAVCSEVACLSSIPASCAASHSWILGL